MKKAIFVFLILKATFYMAFAQQPTDSVKVKIDRYAIVEMYVFNEQAGGEIELKEEFFSQLYMLRIREESKNTAYYSININGEDKWIAFATVKPIECAKTQPDGKASETLCYEGTVISNLLKGHEGYGVIFEKLKLPPHLQGEDVEFVSFTFLFEPRNFVQVIGYKTK